MHSPSLAGNNSSPIIELIIVDFPALIFPIKLILIFVSVRFSLMTASLEVKALYWPFNFSFIKAFNSFKS